MGNRFKELLFDSNTYKKPEILKSKIEWKLLDVNLHIKFVQKSLCLKSKQFYNGKCSAIKWKLRFFPNGYTEDATSIALVYVGNDNSEARIKARFTIYAISSDGKRVDICS
uniref:MATH domain-containing protein n=1 Tax=Meloidogyne floridensis TaxID=298350 RepID=A0A915NTJ1_9BILA